MTCQESPALRNQVLTKTWRSGSPMAMVAAESAAGEEVGECIRRSRPPPSWLPSKVKEPTAWRL